MTIDFDAMSDRCFDRGRESAEIELQGLYEALKAAAYYIERLELVQQRRKVRDMTEAMEHYHRVALPVIAAYESIGI